VYGTVPDQTVQFTDRPGFILVANDHNFDVPILNKVYILIIVLYG
jgi:hypothetical protein